ncbi:MAG: hypothetical protein ACR2IM_01225 [Sediminibacterium sp.]|jgi:hypothetical protein
MMFKFIPLIACVFFINAYAKAQAKVLGECTIQFNIQQQKNNEWVDIGSKKVWIKGNQCKTGLTTPQLVQTLIFNTQEDKAIVTKEMGNNKYLQEIAYPPKSIATLISMKEILADTTVILGYHCNKVRQEWSDGVIYEVYYTPEIIPSVTTYEIAFKEVQGLVLGYRIINKSDAIINFNATKLDLSPITLNQFQINRLDYQILD